jgi:branched-chain amino acid transport system permease protein
VSELVQALWAALLFGSVYGLMAVGLTLIFGALKLLNLAHGALYVAGGYATWWCATGLGVPLVPAMILGMLAAAAVAAVLFGGVIRPLIGAEAEDVRGWVGTAGFALILLGLLRWRADVTVKDVPTLFDGNASLSGVVITYHGIAVVVIAVLSLTLLNQFLRVSRHGLAVRAVSQNLDSALLMGVPVKRVFLIVLCVSGALAGLAGALLTSILGLTPDAGFVPMIKAMIIVILGGIGSVKGTIVGAFMVGALEAFTQVYVGVSWSLAVLFIFIIAFLMVRPYGLFGTPEAQRL